MCAFHLIVPDVRDREDSGVPRKGGVDDRVTLALSQTLGRCGSHCTDGESGNFSESRGPRRSKLRASDGSR